MVVYTCDTCQKKFGKKIDYTRHLNRKNKCVASVEKSNIEIIMTKIEEIVDDNNKLNNRVEILEKELKIMQKKLLEQENEIKNIYQPLKNDFKNISTCKGNKNKIPKKIKQLVWNKYIGEKNGNGLCQCCQVTEIAQMSFQCGHIISEFNGGTITLDNLIPLCPLCNSSMGTMNMDDFMKIYGIKKISNPNKKDDSQKNFW
jgi:hypothetical protein